MPADMQKHRSLLLLVILIPAALLVIMLAGPWKPGQRDARQIALRKVEEVDRIVLADPYNTVELTGVDSSWYLFGSEAVSPVTVENLLYTASRLEVSSIVDREEFELSADSRGDIKELAFFRGDKVLLSLRLRSVSGRFLLNPAGSERAYFVSLPGYPGLDLDRIFSANPDHYRDHLLIDLRPSDIRSIEIALAGGEAFRFSQDQEGNIRCQAENDSTILPRSTPNELAMKLLFSYFTSIRYEQRSGIAAASIPGEDGRIQELATISVSSFKGEQHRMRVFSYRSEPDSEPDLFRALVLYNDEQDALFVNYIYLDVLMRGLSHYFGEK